MILYLDTSAYIKLFIAESGSDSVREAVEKAEVLATHIIAYAEMRGFGRHFPFGPPESARNEFGEAAFRTSLEEGLALRS